MFPPSTSIGTDLVLSADHPVHRTSGASARSCTTGQKHAVGAGRSCPPESAQSCRLTFRVNFLAHESQHYADRRRYPDLQPWELEYRAKLTELAAADATRDDVLASFTANQGDDPADSHSYADKRVLAALRGRLAADTDAALGGVPTRALQQAAKAELEADSARRQSAAR